MKTSFLWGSLGIILSILFLFPVSGTAKEYEIPTIQVEVAVNPDGTIRITRHLTYVFDGDFSWANYELPKKGFYAIRDIQVAEGTTSYINKNTEELQTFLIEESDDSYNIKWFYDAEDEERTFSVSYTLEDAIAIGPDWSELFWVYASDSRNKSTDRITVLIKLPETVDQSQLHSWVREPSWSVESETLDNGFAFTASDISRSQAVTIRTAFPTTIFNESEVEITNPDLTLEWIRNDEEAYHQKQIEAALEQVRLFEFGVEAGIIIAGLSIIFFIYFYRKYGTRHKINLSRNESLMIPGREKPAVIGWLLLHRTVYGGQLTATLLDLARRGYLELKEEEPEEEGWLSSSEPFFTVHLTGNSKELNMPEWESNLLNFLESRIKEEGHKMKDIFKYSDSDVSKWYNEWRTSVSDFAKAKGWIDTGSYKGVFWNLGVQAIFVMAAAAGIFLIHPILAFALAAAVIASALSFVIIRRSPKGEELYQTWKNYQNALKNAKDYSIPNNQLGLHFIYGIAFGLSINNIEQMFEQNPSGISAITWMILLPGSTNSPATMASSFSNLASTGTISSGGGVSGGGAVAGSAGGGGSAGAG